MVINPTRQEITEPEDPDGSFERSVTTIDHRPAMRSVSHRIFSGQSTSVTKVHNLVSCLGMEQHVCMLC